MIKQQISHQYTWAERCIWWSVHSFGAITILACIATGATVLIIIIFRKAIKDKFGDFLKWADNFVNKEK